MLKGLLGPARCILKAVASWVSTGQTTAAGRLLVRCMSPNVGLVPSRVFLAGGTSPNLAAVLSVEMPSRVLFMRSSIMPGRPPVVLGRSSDSRMAIGSVQPVEGRGVVPAVSGVAFLWPDGVSGRVRQISWFRIRRVCPRGLCSRWHCEAAWCCNAGNSLRWRLWPGVTVKCCGLGRSGGNVFDSVYECHTR